MAAIEIVDDRYADWRSLDTLTLIADDFFQAGIVLGAADADWRRLDLAALPGMMAINGEERGRGRGGDVLGHPLTALAWLANQLSVYGIGLRRGQVVLTGSVVAHPVGRAGRPGAGDRRGAGFGRSRVRLTNLNTVPS